MIDHSTPWFKDYVRFLMKIMDRKEVAEILAARGVPFERAYQLLV